MNKRPAALKWKQFVWVHHHSNTIRAGRSASISSSPSCCLLFTGNDFAPQIVIASFLPNPLPTEKPQFAAYHVGWLFHTVWVINPDHSTHASLSPICKSWVCHSSSYFSLHVISRKSVLPVDVVMEIDFLIKLSSYRAVIFTETPKHVIENVSPCWREMLVFKLTAEHPISEDQSSFRYPKAR